MNDWKDTETRKWKKCTRCGKRKEIRKDFYKSRLYHGGYTARCKKCTSAVSVICHRKNPAASARASAKYARTDKGHAMFKRHRVKHREKRRLYMVGWHGENKEHERTYNIKSKIRKKFGISPEEYQSRFAKQNGCCAICLRPEISVDKNGRIKNLAVDHAHANEKLRDLLCMNCNQAIGKFKEDIEVMYRAIAYLENWIKIHAPTA